MKEETTNTRPNGFSKWHRKLGEDYYAVDIDFVEFRKGRGIVAIIGVSGNFRDERHIVNSKSYVWKRTRLEQQVMRQLSFAQDVPCYYVLHNAAMTVFHVHNLWKGLKTYDRFSEWEMSKWIRQL